MDVLQRARSGGSADGSEAEEALPCDIVGKSRLYSEALRHIQDGRHEEHRRIAEELLTRAIVCEMSSNFTSWTRLVELYLVRAEVRSSPPLSLIADALSDCDAALSLAPFNAPALAQKGKVLERADRNHEALESYRRALDHSDPGESSTFQLQAQGDISRLQAQLAEIESAPHQAEAVSVKVRSWRGRARASDAWDLFYTLHPELREQADWDDWD